MCEDRGYGAGSSSDQSGRDWTFLEIFCSVLYTLEETFLAKVVEKLLQIKGVYDVEINRKRIGVLTVL